MKGGGRNSKKSFFILGIASALHWPIDEKYLLNLLAIKT